MATLRVKYRNEYTCIHSDVEDCKEGRLSILKAYLEQEKQIIKIERVEARDARP